MTRQNALKALDLATRHANEGQMASFAQLCLQDAITLFNAHQYADSAQRALNSLEYSVGIFHPHYHQASAYFTEE